MESENPYAHIKEFEEVCNTFREYREKAESVRVFKNYPGKYREKVESVRVSKNIPGEYRKRVESV